MQFPLVFLATVFLTVTAAGAAEHRVLCSFDRTTGFNALDGKTERTRSDLPVSWSIVYVSGTGDTPASAMRSRSGKDVALHVIETPSTVNWQEMVAMGGIELTTVYKLVEKSPRRYLAVQARTDPALSGATPELAIGTCRIDPPF